MAEQRVDRDTARRIINQLKGCTTPLDAAIYLDVGRDKWYRGMHYYFESAEAGESKVRFIVGRYGDGKTHMMSMARDFALQRGFVVSYISAETTRLNKFAEVYEQIAKNLTALQIEGGIEYLLRVWKEQSDKNKDREIDRPKASTGMDINFRVAVQAYLQQQDPEQQDRIAQWLLGKPVKLPELNINSGLHTGKSRDEMRSLSVLLRLMGYKGLLVLVDELDRVEGQTSRVRQDCYQVLRELIDNTGEMRGTLFYFAAPPGMFTSNRGFKEYDALRSRLESPMLGMQAARRDGIDYRGTIINLEDTPLTKNDFHQMAMKVRDIHSQALEWDAKKALPDLELEKIVDQIIEQNLNIRTPRLVTTTIATIADIAQQGESYDIGAEIKNAFDIAERSQAESHRQKYED